STATHKPQSYDNYFDYVWNIVVDNSNTTNDEVYAAVAGALYRSTDGGTSWSAIVVTDWSNWTDVAVTSAGVVYATYSSGDATNKGIYRSTDGITFVEITPGGWPASYNRVVLDISASNEKVVYFLAETPGTGTSGHNLWKYTYVSGDGTGAGGTWVDHTANIPNEGGQTGNFDSQGSYDLILNVKPDDENFVIIGGTNLYTSSDGFATTTNTNWIGGYTSANDSYARYANHHPDQHSISFHPTGANVVLSGHDGGISRTANITAATVAWSALNTGYYTTQFYTVAIDHNSTGNYIVGGMQDNGSWSTSSSSVTTPWNEDLSGDGAFCAKADDPSDFYYVSWQNGGVFRFNTSNGDWTEVDPAGGSGYLFINPFVLDPNDTKKMYLAGGSYLWRNDDLTQIPSFVQSPASKNWYKLVNSFISGETISAVEVSKSPANTVYYGTAEGSLFKIANADTGDAIPEDIGSISFPSGAYVSSINANPLNADEVMVVFSNYEVKSVWYSDNGGSSWSDVSGNLEENSDGSGNGPSVRWVEIVPNSVSEALYMVGTSTGLYSTSTINGTSTVWAQESASNIGNVVVDMIDSRTTDNTVVVATHANGVYSASGVFTAIEDEDQLVPQEFSLEQNYPNPFNPTTTIRYTLNKSEAVTLTVFDISGKKIVDLVRGNQAAGLHTVSWNGKNNSGQAVPSGTYVYRLTTGSKTESRKMTLVK
ncbi:MAG: flagellar basal body rod modification protein, partial [Gammaproteobacteria bacterium]